MNEIAKLKIKVKNLKKSNREQNDQIATLIKKLTKHYEVSHETNSFLIEELNKKRDEIDTYIEENNIFEQCDQDNSNLVPIEKSKTKIQKKSSQNQNEFSHVNTYESFIKNENQKIHRQKKNDNIMSKNDNIFLDEDKSSKSKLI